MLTAACRTGRAARPLCRASGPLGVDASWPAALGPGVTAALVRVESRSCAGTRASGAARSCRRCGLDSGDMVRRRRLRRPAVRPAFRGRLSFCVEAEPLEAPMGAARLRAGVAHPSSRTPARARVASPVRVLHRTATRCSSRAACSTCPAPLARQPDPLVPGRAGALRADTRRHRTPLLRGLPPPVGFSPTYWPLAWPSPEPVTLGVVAGESSIALPLYDAAAAPALLPHSARPRSRRNIR